MRKTAFYGMLAAATALAAFAAFEAGHCFFPRTRCAFYFADGANAPRVDGPAVGPRDAALQLVVYTDLTIRECAAFESSLDSLTRRYGTRLRIAYRLRPIASSRARLLCAAAAVAADFQGKFRPFKDELARSKLSHDTTDRAWLAETFAAAGRAGLDTVRLRRDMKGAAARAAVDSAVAAIVKQREGQK